MPSRGFMDGMGPYVIVHGSADAAINANDVQVDTGALSDGGLWQFIIHTSNNNAASPIKLVLERRNAANGTTLESMTLNIPAESSLQFDAFFLLAVGERVRVIAGETVASIEVQCSIFGNQLFP